MDTRLVPVSSSDATLLVCSVRTTGRPELAVASTGTLVNWLSGIELLTCNCSVITWAACATVTLVDPLTAL